MAVESILRGTMVLGVLIIGGIIAGSQLRDRLVPERAAARLERTVEAGVERSLERAPGETEAAAEVIAGLEDGWTDADTTNADTRVTIDARAGEQGRVALELPGGFGLKLPMRDTSLGTGFELGGVKPYPGARLMDIEVRVRERRGGRERSLLSMDFEAPADPASIASYYEKGIREAGGQVRRSGNRLAGSTAEGKEFSLSLRSMGTATRGTLRIRDS